VPAAIIARHGATTSISISISIALVDELLLLLLLFGKVKVEVVVVAVHCKPRDACVSFLCVFFELFWFSDAVLRNEMETERSLREFERPNCVLFEDGSHGHFEFV